jgi:hypothetical protein
VEDTIRSLRHFEQTGELCFRGEVPQAAEGQDAADLYAVIGFDLCGMPSDFAFLPEPFNTWEPETRHPIAECANALASISFTIMGNLPPELRLVFWELGREEHAYLAVTSTGCHTAAIADARVFRDRALDALGGDSSPVGAWRCTAYWSGSSLSAARRSIRST